MKLGPRDLENISSATLEHYASRAQDFFEGTKDHDVSQNIDALLKHIPGNPPFSILDFGCGPGRDLRTFSKMGHLAIGLEGCANFARMAIDHSGCEVWNQDFLKLDLPACRFDGIFANASLFHIPRQELPRALNQLHASLRQDGVLFSSNPRGANEEGWRNGRYGTYHDLASWRQFMLDAGFLELDHYYRPANLPFEQQLWLASVWRKIS